MQIYVNKNNQQLGPFDEKKVVEMLKSGQLSANDLAVRQGEEQWQPLGNLFPADSVFTATPNPLTQESNPPRKGFGCSRLIGIALILLSVITFIGGLVNYLPRNFQEWSCAAAEREYQKTEELFNKLPDKAKYSTSLYDLTPEEKKQVEEWKSQMEVSDAWRSTCLTARSAKSFWVKVTIGISAFSLLIGIIGLVMVFVRRKS